MPDLRPATLILSTVLLVAACGGASSSASPGTASVSPTQAGATATAGNDGASSEPVGTTGPTNGGSTTGVCDLVTLSELEGILGVSPLETAVELGPPDTCSVKSNQAPVAAFVFDPDAKLVYDVLVKSADTLVSGLGDGAFYSAGTRLLMVLKGNATLSIAIFAGDKTDAQVLDELKQIAAKAVGRM